MNRQDSNNPFTLWLALLVLPILALAVYLHFDKTPVPDAPGDLIQANSTALDAIPQSVNDFKLATPPTPDVPEAHPLVTPPVGLDPEVARAAVHKVENGVYERATAMFELEPIDVDWAGNYEQALRDMFSQHQGLQRVSINSIRCHTSMCRIEVFTPRDADADFFTAMFYDGLATFRAGELKAEAAITRRMEQGMTSVYVARKDHTLGFY